MTQIAVYGTLRKDQPNYYRLGLDNATYLGQDWVDGCLYNLGAFPGAKFDHPGIIAVDVFEVNKETLHMIDSLEGYDPTRTHNPFYVRKTVALKNSKTVVYSYEYVPGVEGHEPIEHGDWTDYRG